MSFQETDVQIVKDNYSEIFVSENIKQSLLKRNLNSTRLLIEMTKNIQPQLSDASLIDDAEFQKECGMPLDQLFSLVKDEYKYAIGYTSTVANQRDIDDFEPEEYNKLQNNSRERINRFNKVLDCADEAIKTGTYKISAIAALMVT